MSEYVDEIVAQKAYDEGIKIGETEPCRESKGSWWEVYKTSKGIIACVLTSWGVSCGEKITEDELHMYVDNLEAAKVALRS